MEIPSISSLTIIVSIASFTVGCLITTIIFIAINSSQQHKIEKQVKERHEVVSAIGVLCASIENSFSSYRVGSIDFSSLREILLSKIEDISVKLNANIDILDAFYVKNIERFIEDQRAFLVSNINRGTSVGTEEKRARGMLRVNKESAEEFVQEKDLQKRVDITPAPPSPQPEFEPPSLEALRPMPGITSPPTEMISPIPEKPAFEEESLRETPQVSREFDISEKPVDIEKREHDLQKEPFSAFESGATAQISLDKIEEIQRAEKSAIAKDIPIDESKAVKSEIPEEPSLQPFDEKQVAEFVAPVEVPESEEYVSDVGAVEKYPTVDEERSEPKPPVEEKPSFHSAFDIEATQEYNLQDIITKESTAKRDVELKEGAVSEYQEMPTSEKESVFEVDIDEKPLQKDISQIKKQDTDKRKIDKDNNLITGNDVMDQLDSFFGFDS